MRERCVLNSAASTGKRMAVAVGAAVALLAVLIAPAGAASQGFIRDELPVGFFYGTFGESPNVVLLAGGTVEEFCEDNPEAPFGAAPGVAPLRVFPRSDGSTDLKVNAKDQPINLYLTDIEGAPPWVGQACAEFFATGVAPQPFASGTADLKVRTTVVNPDLVDVFNSVNGIAFGTEGTGFEGKTYRVKAQADLVVENGVPVGDPADFVGFSMQEIRR